MSTTIQPMAFARSRALSSVPTWLLRSVGILAIPIGVVNEQPHSATFAAHGVFDHLHVGVGIAKGQDRPTSDVLIDTDRLARLSVDKVDFRHANELRLTVFDLEFGYGTGTDDLFRRNAVIFFGDGRMNWIPPPETMKVLNPFARK